MLGDTLARIDGGPTSSFIQEAGTTEPSKLVDWIGDYNTFIGWSEFLTTGGNRAVKLASLDDLRKSFPRSASRSHEMAAPWPAAVVREWTTPIYLEQLAPEAIATLRGIAVGNPFLLERSVGAFPKLLVPEIVPLPEIPATPPPHAAKAAPARKIKLYAETKVAGRPAPKTAKPAAAEPAAEGPLDLVLDLADPTYAGDLGRFLNAHVPDDATHVRVVVDGQGAHPCTPFEVVPGSLLEIFVRSSPGPNPPTWVPLPGAPAEALISVKGADLTILGARFERDGGSSLKSIIHIEDGLLTLAKCWLIAPSLVSDGGGRLVDFRSIGTKPLTARDPKTPPIPVARLTDCLMLTGGTAINAELGLGVISLNNCAIASGSDAIALHPAKVARFRFAVDLWLNRCTVIADRAILRLGPWRGSEPGPNRPWLVSSHDCAFLDPFDRGQTPRQTVVLRDDPNGLSRGALVWQSSNDAYEVGHFIVMTDGPLPGVNKPDIQREWVAFWGGSHIGRVLGPLRNAPSTPHVKLLQGDLKPGSITPSDLAIDTKYSQAHKADRIGADVSRLGIQAERVLRKPR
jgi:serine/threonine-protein kinase